MNNYTGSVSSYDFPTPKVVIPRNVYTKMMYWVSKAGYSECSGLGKTVFEDGKIKVVDAWMVKQRNTSGTTDMDEDAIGTLLYEKRETPGIMNFWWHSHANMGVFWSGTDRDQINKIASNGSCLAIVFNNKKETLACVAIGQPIPMYINGVQVTVEEPYDQDVINTWNAEYDAAVEKHKTYPHSSRYGYGGYIDDSDWGGRAVGAETGKGTELTKNVIGFRSESNPEDPVFARVRRIQELDTQIETLDFLLQQKNPTYVNDRIKAICGFPAIMETHPDRKFWADGRQTTWIDLAMSKQFDLEEELNILIGTYRDEKKKQETKDEGMLTK